MFILLKLDKTYFTKGYNLKVKEIYNILNEISPFNLQEKWDNSSLNVGSFDDDISDIAISMDVDSELVENLENNSLLITHHPLFFSNIKKLSTTSYPSNIATKMIKKDISHISMHTNFDKTHLNDYVFEEILGFKIVRKEGFLCYGEIDMSMDNLFEYVRDRLKLPFKKIVKSKEEIKTIALCTGSGGSFIPSIKVDCFLSGDIKYHDGLNAYENNVNIIDIGHFESEIFFSDIMYKELKKNGIKAIIQASKNPFQY